MKNPGEALPTSKNAHLQGRAREVGGSVGVEGCEGGVTDGIRTLVRLEGGLS